MANRIRLDHQAVDHVGREFLRAKGRSAEAASTLTSRVDALGADWEGDSRIQFNGDWSECQAQLKNLPAQLEAIGTQLQGIARRFRELDESSR